MPMVAAAYNAGPAAHASGATAPCARTPPSGAENIPFSETRDYVKKVLANTKLRGAHHGQPQSPKARLGTVGLAGWASRR